MSVSSRLEDFSASELFQIASDIESYPKFLPYCIASRILDRKGHELTVDNVFGAGPFRVRFTTLARFNEPVGIEISSQDPQFKCLSIKWRFDDSNPDGCLVDFEMSQVFVSALKERALEVLAGDYEHRLIDKFESRARTVFGRPQT